MSEPQEYNDSSLHLCLFCLVAAHNGHSKARVERGLLRLCTSVFVFFHCLGCCSS